MDSFKFERIGSEESSSRFTGGLVTLKQESGFAEKDLDVSWFYVLINSHEGAVTWNFRNRSLLTKRFILFRNKYYFGSAFWPLFVNDPGFNVEFATSIDPLPEVPTFERNNSSAPLAIVEQPNGEHIVAFVFTLPARGSFQLIEGGFPEGRPPENAKAIKVRVLGVRDCRIRYDPKHEEVWNEMVRYKSRNYRAYEPNPSTFRAALVEPIEEMPVQENFLFNDEIEVKDVGI